jgi:hypothetical protein
MLQLTGVSLASLQGITLIDHSSKSNNAQSTSNTGVRQDYLLIAEQHQSIKAASK